MGRLAYSGALAELTSALALGCARRPVLLALIDRLAFDSLRLGVLALTRTVRFSLFERAGLAAHAARTAARATRQNEGRDFMIALRNGVLAMRWADGRWSYH